MTKKKRLSTHKYVLTALLLFSVALIDQLTKFVVSHKMTLGESIPVINEVFHITLVHNTGSAFGLFKGANMFLIFVSIAVLIGVFYALQKVKENEKLMQILLGLLAGGALGNLIDRVVLGHVVDFLDFRVWPVFNVADSSLSIAIVGLIILLWNE